MARKNAIVSAEINNESGELKFTVQGVGTLTIGMADIHPSIARYAALHGLKQRIGDAAAQERDGTNGASATPQEKYDAMARLVEWYKSGTTEWAVKRDGAANGEGGEAGLTYRAYAKVQGIEIDDARAKIAAVAEKKGTTTKAILAALRKASPDIRHAMDELRAPAVDADDLIGELIG